MRAKGIRMYKHTMSCVVCNELMCASQGYPIHTQPTLILVRAKGIEPSPKAWEAFVLPLYYARDVWRNIILFYQQCPEFISGVVLVCRPAVLQHMNCVVYLPPPTCHPISATVASILRIFQYICALNLDSWTIEYL